MIYSMTAFGRTEQQGGWGVASWEIRSINHRYLEVSVRLPEMLRDLEQVVRETIQQHFHRGKIECNLKFQAGSALGAKIGLNDDLIKQLIELTKDIDNQLPEKISRVNLLDILNWRGVIIEESFNIELVRDNLINLLENAVQDVKAGRQREGASLEKIIRQKLLAIEEQIAEIKTHLPRVLERMREKTTEKLQEVKLALDPQRLEQEMVYFAQKIDIQEEIDRTLTHIAEVKRTLDKGDQVGRRLDFMMQELNREANTIGSKSVDVGITHAAVAMKVLIEQIREQVQNIE